MTPQHWIANNLFGLAFALNGVELLHLNNVSTGCILLGGLFVYDVFWVSRRGGGFRRTPASQGGDNPLFNDPPCLCVQVFGTNVMVTVAKSFEAPIKCE